MSYLFVDDEFNDSTINSPPWTEDYNTDGGGAEGTSQLVITAGTGTIWSSSADPSGIYRAIGSSVNFDVRLNIYDTTNYTYATDGVGTHLMFWISSTYYISIVAISKDGSDVYLGYCYCMGASNGSGTSGSVALQNMELRMRRSGSNLYIYYRTSGGSWTQLSSAKAVGSGAGRIWISVNKGAGASFTSTFGWLRSIISVGAPLPNSFQYELAVT